MRVRPAADDDVTEVRLADLHVGHLPDFLAPYSGPRLIPTPLDVRDRDAVLGAMRDCDAVMSAIPYYFNYELARSAVEAGVHFCDLGGNTEIVFKQKELDAEAKQKNITVVPDCGLAPGMVNILAEYGIAQLDSVDSVKIFVGGLPQHPEPPLNYMLVYSLEGALDYYTTLSWVLRDGKRTQVTALSEREPVDVRRAARHARGVSHRGRSVDDGVPVRGQDPDDGVQDAPLSRARRADGEQFASMGLLDLEPVDVKGTKVVPRDAFIAVGAAEAHEAEGPRSRRAARRRDAARRTASRRRDTFELVDRYDEEHGISAMMRTTGYSLSITGLMQVRGEVKPAGVHTPDECIPARASTSPSCESAGSTSRNALSQRLRRRALRWPRRHSLTNSAIVAPI